MMNGVVVKEFGSELAGQRVGWVAAHENKGDKNDFVHVNIAVGTVATGGGAYTYVDRPSNTAGDADDICWYRTTGIVAGFSMEASISRSEGIHPHGGIATVRQERDDGAGSLFLSGASRIVRVTEEDKRWALSASLLKDSIRQTMKEADVFTHYPSLYYWLNGMMCHGYLLDRAKIDVCKTSSMLIVDTKMAATTQRQIVAAGKIIEGLDANIAGDVLMRESLKVNSETNPEVFEESRRVLEVREKAISGAAANLLVPSLVHTPVGNGPGSRSFPYMGAYPDNERANFGIELDALRRGNTSIADVELARELKELKERRLWAGHGLATLAEMHSLESGLA